MHRPQATARVGVLPESVEAVGSGPLARPHPEWSFAGIPPTVCELLGARPGPGSAVPLPGFADAVGERPQRVVLVLLDAFGWAFLDRHREHPFVARLHERGTIAKLTTQFPSTTTAHVTTICTGLPVGAHGLYEWSVYEPSLETVIVPLVHSFAGSFEPGTLGAEHDPRVWLAPDRLVASLATAGHDAVTFQPEKVVGHPFPDAAFEGARVEAYTDLAPAVHEAVAAPEALSYLYWDRIDYTGHLAGPSSAEFDAEATAALDALDAATAQPRPGTLLLLCADHGQVDVAPDRVDYVDDAVAGLLRLEQPAGSSRDCFLHTTDTDRAVTQLRELLGDRATVHATEQMVADGLFGAHPGPRLLDRLADVCVLPAGGRQAWLRSAASVEQAFRGHHGGLERDEAETYLAALAL